MAEEKKEAFLDRWSRLKSEQNEAPAPVKDETAAPALPPVESSRRNPISPFMRRRWMTRCVVWR